MSNLAYFRVSTYDQSVEAQRRELLRAANLESFDREFKDEGISGATLAFSRKGFGELKAHLRKGDTLFVYSIDRLGRDSIDIQLVIRDLLQAEIKVFVAGIGLLSQGVGEIITAVLAQLAQLERVRIKERTDAGRKVAKDSLRKTGRTHKGKLSLGRPKTIDYPAIAKWRKDSQASIAATAMHFGISTASVKRAMRH